MRDLIIDFIDRYEADHHGSAALAPVPMRVSPAPAPDTAGVDLGS